MMLIIIYEVILYKSIIQVRCCLNIPSFFVKRNGEPGQFAFSNSDGTYITADTNIASLIIPDPRKNGITKSFAKTGISKSSFLGSIAEYKNVLE